MEISISLQVSQNLCDAIDRLAAALGVKEAAPEAKPVEAGPSLTIPVVEPTAETPEVDSEIPKFVDEDEKRNWYINTLTSHQIDFRPRTRTSTMEQIWQDHIQKIVEAGQPEVLVERKIKKTDVTDVLRTYITTASDEVERDKRREQVKHLLSQCGATNITELAEEHYERFINTFGGGDEKL